MQLAALKVAHTWSPMPLSAQYGGDLKLVIVALVYMVPLYVLVVLSVWRGSLPAAAKLYLLAPAIYFTLIHAVSVGSLRYRMPADLPMIVVAAGVIGQKDRGKGQK
jgi:hypothetical protein